MGVYCDATFGLADDKPSNGKLFNDDAIHRMEIGVRGPLKKSSVSLPYLVLSSWFLVSDGRIAVLSVRRD